MAFSLLAIWWYWKRKLKWDVLGSHLFTDSRDLFFCSLIHKNQSYLICKLQAGLIIRLQMVIASAVVYFVVILKLHTVKHRARIQSSLTLLREFAIFAIYQAVRKSKTEVCAIWIWKLESEFWGQKHLELAFFGIKIRIPHTPVLNLSSLEINTINIFR